MMTTRRAAAVLHQIINTDLRLRVLDKEEIGRIQSSDWLRNWADATVETFGGGMYKGIRVTHRNDDTVLAAFEKRDRRSYWKQASLGKVEKSEPTDTVKYRLFVGGHPSHRGYHRKEPERRTKDRPNEKRKGAPLEAEPHAAVQEDESDPPWDWQLWVGSIWLENRTTKKLFQVMDHENIPRQETLRPQDIVEEAIKAENGTWKLADVLHSVNDFKKVSLWACIDENDVIIDVSSITHQKSF